MKTKTILAVLFALIIAINMVPAVAYADDVDNSSYSTDSSETSDTDYILESIDVTTPPAKLEYFAGESFNPADMVVTASYSDGNIAAIYDFSYTPQEKLTVDDNEITISYTEGEISKVVHLSITVRASEADVEGVSLNEESLTLKVDTFATLVATVVPVDARNKDVIWESSNTDVVIVDEEGFVTAVAAGTADITVKTAEGDFTAICKVTVEDVDSPVIEDTSEPIEASETSTESSEAADDSSEVVPKAGDSNNTALWIVAIIISVLGVASTIALIRKKRATEK